VELSLEKSANLLPANLEPSPIKTGGWSPQTGNSYAVYTATVRASGDRISATLPICH